VADSVSEGILVVYCWIVTTDQNEIKLHESKAKRVFRWLKPLWLFAVVFGILLVIDLVTKYVFTGVTDGTFIPRVISIHYTQNRGVAFGWFYGAGIWLIVVTALMIIGGSIGYILYRRRLGKKHEFSENLKKDKRMLRLFDIAFAFFLAGAVGNLVDRIFLGYVRDFLRLDFVDFAIFNLADVFINIGVVLLVVFFVIEFIRDWKTEKNKKIIDKVVDVEKSVDKEKKEAQFEVQDGNN